MGDFSRYEGKLPGRDTTTADLRQQQRTVQEETRRMIAALRRELTEKISSQADSISALGTRVTGVEEAAASLDERVTALEEEEP